MKTDCFVDPTTTTGKKRKLGVIQQVGVVGRNNYEDAFEGANSDIGLFCDFWKTVCLLNNDWTEEHAAHVQQTKAGYVAGEQFADFIDKQLRSMDAEDIMNNASYERHRDLTKHPIYIVLGFVISKQGLGFDISRFSDSDKFKRMITPKFLARILFACIKSGERLFGR